MVLVLKILNEIRHPEKNKIYTIDILIGKNDKLYFIGICNKVKKYKTIFHWDTVAAVSIRSVKQINEKSR